MEENTEKRLDLTLFSEKIQALKDRIATVIVGQEQIVDLVLTAVLANGHVLLEGVPGVAKTLLARLVARLIKADFSRIQFTPDLMPSDVLGTTVFNMKTNDFDFHQGPVFADLVLVDEINRAPAKTQAALFEVMEEGNEDTIAAVNDLSEDTRKELDDIYLALSQLAEKQKHVNKQTERRPIGFAHYKENNKK